MILVYSSSIFYVLYQVPSTLELLKKNIRWKMPQKSQSKIFSEILKKSSFKNYSDYFNFIVRNFWPNKILINYEQPKTFVIIIFQKKKNNDNNNFT